MTISGVTLLRGGQCSAAARHDVVVLIGVGQRRKGTQATHYWRVRDNEVMRQVVCLGVGEWRREVNTRERKRERDREILLFDYASPTVTLILFLTPGSNQETL